jgi:GH35 family endo-1,4-beta-xylanase
MRSSCRSIFRSLVLSALSFCLLPVLVVGTALFAGCDSGGGSSTACETPPCDADSGEEERGLNPLVPQRYRYDGWQEEAEWRDRARRRIENHRMDSLEVTVVDADGNPVEGATVDVQMKRHEFHFGTAVNADIMREQTSSDADPYRKHLRENFNYATIENRLKVYRWEAGESEKEDVHFTVDWLSDHDFGVRGHAAFWEEWWWMNIDENQPGSEVHQQVKSKIRDRLTEFEGHMTDWDAQNHPFHRSQIRPKVASDIGVTEKEVVAEWWKAANEADAQARMGINEQNILVPYDCCDWASDYRSYIQDLIDRGVEVEGIGVMGHANVNRFTGIPEVLNRLQRLGEFGIPLYISEFHITLEDWGSEDTQWSGATQTEKDAQTAYLRDFLTAFFSIPQADTFVYWTFWEGRAWRRTSALYGPNWYLRDHGEKFQELVHERWWTDRERETGGEGTVAVQGFKGTYAVSVTEGDRSGSASATLSDGGASVEVTIE